MARWTTHFAKYLYMNVGIYEIVSLNEKDWFARFMPKDPDFDNMIICEGVSKHTAMKRCRDHHRALMEILND